MELQTDICNIPDGVTQLILDTVNQFLNEYAYYLLFDLDLYSNITE